MYASSFRAECIGTASREFVAPWTSHSEARHYEEDDLSGVVDGVVGDGVGRRGTGHEPPCRSDLEGGTTYLTEVKGRNASFHPLSARRTRECDYARP